MKKTIITLILAGLILVPAFYANADVLVEIDNNFYNKNQRYIVPLVEMPRGGVKRIIAVSDTAAGQINEYLERTYPKYGCLDIDFE